MVPMSNQIDQHAERGLPFNTDWEQASLMGSLPTGLVHCFLGLTVPNIKHLIPRQTMRFGLGICVRA